MATDALVLVKAEHKEIKSVFNKFQAAAENATKTKGQLVQKMVELLTVHTYLENELIYPEVRKLLPDLEDDILESYEEHHVADVLCVELAVMRPDAERFDAKTTVLIENVAHHIEEERARLVSQGSRGTQPFAALRSGCPHVGAEGQGAAQPGSAQRVEEDHRCGVALAATASG
jgi:hypothetical protein